MKDELDINTIDNNGFSDMLKKFPFQIDEITRQVKEQTEKGL